MLLKRLGLTSAQLPIFIGLMTWILVLGNAAGILWGERLNPPNLPPATPAVLGSRSDSYTPGIEVSDTDGYGNGGVIELASTDEPAVSVSSYDVTGDVTIDIFQASEVQLLAYLIHNQDGKQLNPQTSSAGLTQIGTVHHTLTKDYETNSRVTLPLAATGIFLLNIHNDKVNTTAFVVRSGTGVLAKSGDNEFIFWAQDFATHRSTPSGSLTLYNLKDSPKPLQTAVFNDQGLATTTITQDAEIGLYHKDTDLALLPLNLRYLNAGSNYPAYTPKQRQVKYFTFTDRPLYKPGDTVYFKAVIRDDDDARYTIPGGSVQVDVFQGWGDTKEVLYSRSLPVSNQGSIDGQVTLPPDAKTGNYTVQVDAHAPNNIWGYASYGTTYFDVEYYRKPEYFLTVTSPKSEYIAGDTLDFKVTGEYFFGQPLANQKVTYSLTGSSYFEYSYLADRNYLSNDNFRYGGWYGPEITSGSVTLDAKGVGHLPIPATVKDGKSLVYSLDVKTVASTGTSDEAVTNVLVYSGEFGIYRKSYDWGYGVNQAFTVPLVVMSRAGSPVGSQSLSVVPTRHWWVAQPIPPGQKYPTYLEKTETLAGQTLTTNSLGEAAITFTAKDTGSYVFRVTGLDRRGNLVSQEFSLWVSDTATPTYNGSGAPSLEVRVDKTKAAPGDTVHATLVSTIPDRDVFLSLERGRVNRYQLVSLTGTSGGVDLPLVDTDMPNITLKASSFSTDWLDDSQIDLPVSTLSKDLRVTLTPDRETYGPGDTVTLNVETLDGRGNPVAAETAVWAVDKALFELVDQSPLDIFNAFWSNRYDSTAQSHSLEGISANMAEGGGCFAQGTPVLMSDGRGKAIDLIKAGDQILTRQSPTDPRLVPAKVTQVHSAVVDGYLIVNGLLKVTPNHKLFINGRFDEANTLQLGDILTDTQNRPVTVTSLEWQRGRFTVYNLIIDQYHTFMAQGLYVHNDKGEARTVFKDSAYWNPRVMTDSSGHAQISFKLPDNLTTWTLAAVGASVDTVVGNAKHDIQVSQAVIVQPVLPNVIRVGDTLKVSALIHNFTPVDHPFTPRLTFDAGAIATATVSALVVPAGDFAQVDWTVMPQTVNPKAKFTFSAIATDDPKAQDTVVQTLPVEAYGFTDANGDFAGGNHTFSLTLGSDVDPTISQVTLTLSPTLVGSLPQAMEYLVNYPYGCVEQTTSRLVPLIIATENKDFYASALQGKSIPKMMAAGIGRLQSLQNYDGGWAWWSGSSDAFVSAYVTEYLVRAQQAGLIVDPALISGVKQYFQNLSNQPVDTQVAKAYALSFLSPSTVKPLLVNLQDLSPDVLPLAVIVNFKAGVASPDQNGLSLLLSKAQTQGDSSYFTGGSQTHFGSNDGTTALSIKALLTAKADRNRIASAVRYLVQTHSKYYWANTFATAQVIDALTRFAQTGSETTPNFSYTVTLDGRSLTTGQVSSATQALKPVVLPVKTMLTGSHSLVITQTGAGSLYSTLVSRLFHTDKQAPAVSHGLTLTREYQSDKGPGYTLAVGDTVDVKLTLSGLATAQSYGVIHDELPAGLIPINPGFKNEQSQASAPNYFWLDGVSGFDVTENGMVISLYQVSPGSRTYTYKARVVNAGIYAVPPATAELMYSPEINARTAAEMATIGTVAQFDPSKVKSQPPMGLPQGYILFTNWGGGELLVVGVFGLLLLVSGFLVWHNRHHRSSQPKSGPPTPPPVLPPPVSPPPPAPPPSSPQIPPLSV